MRRLAAIFAALLFVAAPVAAQPVVQTVEEHDNSKGEIDRRGSDFVHRATGYVFPGQLADMPARKTFSYGPGDGSLYYTLNGGGNGDAWLSLFVSKARAPLAETVAAVEEALLNAMPGRVVDRPAGLPPLPVGAAERWFDSNVEGKPVLTGYRLRIDNGYVIKVRLTIPKAGGQDALDRGWRALSAVKWSLPLRTASLR